MWYHYRIIDIWSNDEIERSVVEAVNVDEAETKISDSMAHRDMTMAKYEIFQESNVQPDVTL